MRCGAYRLNNEQIDTLDFPMARMLKPSLGMKLQIFSRRFAAEAAFAVLVCLSAASAAAQQSSNARQHDSPEANRLAQEALAQGRQGNYSQAQALWERVVKVEPRNAQAYAQLGLMAARQEHYSEAITAYRKAKSLNPDIPELNLDLALALFKAEQFHEAAQVLEAEHRKQPEDRRITILAAMSHYGAREFEAAIPHFKDAVEADPKNLDLLLALAHCYLWTKQFDATMGVYKQILEINPDSAAADMIAGEALDEKGDNAGALQQFRAAVIANPKEPNVHFGLAYLLWAQKRYDEAIPEFKKELENDPQNSQAMIYLGDTYAQQGNFADAKTMLEAAEKYQPKFPLIHLDLGIANMETGENDAAISELKETIGLEPDNVTAHFRLATLYRKLGKRDEARVEFAKASSLNKKTDDSLYKRIQDANAKPNLNTKPSQPAPENTPNQP